MPPGVEYVDFGQQWIGSPPKWAEPSTPFRRYVHDLYGPAGYNWMPFLNGAAIALASALAFVVLLGWVA